MKSSNIKIHFFFLISMVLLALSATSLRTIKINPIIQSTRLRPQPTSNGPHLHPQSQFLSRRLLNSDATSSTATPCSHYKKEILAPSESTNKQEMGEAVNTLQLRHEFLQVLRSRRTHEVPLEVLPAKPVKHPCYVAADEQLFKEACPKKEISNFNELLQEENFYLTTEAGEQGRLPVLLFSLKDGCEKKKPAVVFLHSTNKCKEWFRPVLECYASRGYIAIAVDSRYHGERASSNTTYRDALISAWKKGDTMPFIYDTVWDLIKLADYLTQREDVDSSRIGITGISLGGMHSWFSGFVEPRYSVVVPIIGVQGFRWAIDNDKWQARVDSIKDVFEVAKKDLGKSAIDKEVVEKVWARIAPGLDSIFDSPYSVPPIAPRPLLILNGENDPRCPVDGLKVPNSRTYETYEQANGTDKFKFIAQQGIGHEATSFMVKEAGDWFDKFL